MFSLILLVVTDNYCQCPTSNSLDVHDCNCKLANILHGLCLALRVHSASALGFCGQNFGWSVSVPFSKNIYVFRFTNLLFSFLLFALPTFKGLIEITPSFLPRSFKMTSQISMMENGDGILCSMFIDQCLNVKVPDSDSVPANVPPPSLLQTKLSSKKS